MGLRRVSFAFVLRLFFFFNDTATTEIYTLSLHDALPISPGPSSPWSGFAVPALYGMPRRSEEHTSELQSRLHLVCRLLLEKKNTTQPQPSKPPTTNQTTQIPIPNTSR